MTAPSVSVVVTCYREGERLGQALACLDRQTETDFQRVLVNDASPCEVTNGICRRAAAQGDTLVVWRKRNGGPAVAKNDGVRRAGGDVIVPLDADDVLPASAVGSIRRAFAEHPEADIVFGDYIRRELGGGSECVINCGGLQGAYRGWNPAALLQRWILLGTTPCRRRLWQRLGGQREEFSFAYHDADFWMRAILAGARGVYVNAVLYEYNRSEGGINSNIDGSFVRRLQLRNLDFHDRFGDGEAVRRRHMDDYCWDSAYPHVRREGRTMWWCLRPRARRQVLPFLRFSLLMFVHPSLLAPVRRIRRHVERPGS